MCQPVKPEGRSPTYIINGHSCSLDGAIRIEEDMWLICLPYSMSIPPNEYWIGALGVSRMSLGTLNTTTMDLSLLMQDFLETDESNSRDAYCILPVEYSYSCRVVPGPFVWLPDCAIVRKSL